MEESPPEEYPHEWADRYGPPAYAPAAYVRPAVARGKHYELILAVRCISAVIGGTAAAFWALVVFVMLSSAFDTNPATDPHGYAIVFGVLTSVPVSLFCALVLPFVAPKRWWGRAVAISLLALVAVNALVFWLLSISGAG